VLRVQALSCCTEDNDLVIKKPHDGGAIVGGEPELKLGQDAARDPFGISHCASLPRLGHPISDGTSVTHWCAPGLMKGSLTPKFA
jgi:hypothetical protein